MKRFTFLLGAVAALAVAHAALAGLPAPTVPEDIAVPAGHRPFLVADAAGVQIYRCDATATGHAWSFVAPRADVYDKHGRRLISHFAGPSWQAKDGSSVVGRVETRVPVADTIPWLRLAADSTSAGAGGDRLAGTTYVQRLDTTGGLAPSAETCNETTVGGVAEVPYTAVYAFWKARS
jgi:hypothetical protein